MEDSYVDKNIIFKVNPVITADQLWDFYVRNDICEVGFGKEIAVLPLKHSSLIVGAFENDKLVGIARAMFDGVSADIVEFCIECKCQGEDLCYDNGTHWLKKINTVLVKEWVISR